MGMTEKGEEIWGREKTGLMNRTTTLGKMRKEKKV